MESLIHEYCNMGFEVGIGHVELGKPWHVSHDELTDSTWFDQKRAAAISARVGMEAGPA